MSHAVRRHAILLGALCWLAAPVARAQTDARYSELAPDAFLKRWLVLGPIPIAGEGAAAPSDEAQSKAFDADLLAACGGEAALRLPPPASCSYGGHEYRFSLVASEGDVVDLAKALGRKDNSIAYALAELGSEAAARVLAGIGSDDAVKVWLNGKVVHRNWVQRAAEKDQDLVSLELSPGANRLLLKVQNGIGDWSLAVRRLGPKGLEQKLWQAAREGDVDTLGTVIAHGQGMRIDAPTRWGLSAWQVARVLGQAEAAELLAARGADTRAPLPKPDAVVDAIFSELVKDRSPGAAVLVSQGGKVLFEKAYGYASLELGVKLSPQMKFRIGSITKQFTAAAILRLAEQGKLSVDDPLSKYWPGYPKGDEVKLHHLLTHTSGIHSYTSKPDFLKTVTLPVEPEEHIKSFENDPYDFAPGARWSYSNSGYFLLGHIVAKVSGRSYGEFLKQEFFDPLGMKDTGVVTGGTILQDAATGYAQDGSTLKKAIDWEMSRAGGAGALYSTVEDLDRWNEAVFEGKLLAEASRKAAWTPVRTAASPDAPADEGYGYGWGIGRLRGLQTIGHGGGLQGFVSDLTRFPAERLTVVVLANAAPPPQGLDPGRLSRDVAQVYLSEKMEARRQPKTIALTPEALESFVGRYDYGNAVLTVTRDGSRLYAQLAGQPRFEIFPSAENEFFWKVVEARVTFVKDAAGRVTKAVHRQGGSTIDAPRLADLPPAADVAPEALDAYVGKYDYGQKQVVLTVTREGKQLFAQLTGQPRFEIFPTSADVFVWKVVEAKITFVRDAAGKVRGGVHEQGGQRLEVPRIE